MNREALEAAARAALGEEVWDAPETTDNLKQYWRDTMCEGIEAFIAALPDEGWQLVPKEMTQEMVDAAGTNSLMFLRRWREVLAAAPEPPE